MSSVTRKGPDIPLFRGKLGSCEFMIFQFGEMDGYPTSYYVDQVNFDRIKTWSELPRAARTPAACKAIMTKLAFERVEWEAVEPRPEPS